MITSIGRTAAGGCICLAIALSALACSSGARLNPFLADAPDAPAAIRAACDTAVRRCSRCHTVDRVLTADPVRPQHWRRYVKRMRLMPASRISKADAATIVDCLVYSSFGAEGLKAIEGAGR